MCDPVIYNIIGVQSERVIIIAFWVSVALLGILLAVVGGIGLIGYLNLTVSGFSLYEYWHFIILIPELYLFAGGLLLAVIGLICLSRTRKK
ncbi:hypothetical protein [Natribacillus halophilus]|uniref:hypothetical protein n=1 Tax=Natribacillus halophilus TaxID=549003 RepID=UPI00115FF3B1|nr:hypothetical protein [Natribacillus halophilus]